MPFSARALKKNIFFAVDIVVKNKSNVVKRGMYSYRQFVADSRGAAEWVHNILTTVMTHIVVDKSTYHVKPHSIS